MKSEQLVIKYVLTTYDELSSSEQTLVDKAKEACTTAYAPYSKFRVGAAVELEDGTIVTGSNQENAAFPSGICAERCALFYANSQYPNLSVKAMAVAAIDKNGVFTMTSVSPCGECRQALLEAEQRYGHPIRTMFCGVRQVILVESVQMLLPFLFGHSILDD